MKLDTMSLPSDDGKPMHIKHAAGHLCYDGEGADDFGRLVDRNKPHKPVVVFVRPWHGQTVQDAIMANARDKMADDDGERGRKRLIEALISGWDGFDDLPVNSANKAKLCDINIDLERQVVAFAQDQSRFFEIAAKD